MTSEERFYSAKIYANKHNSLAKNNIQDVPYVELGEGKKPNYIKNKSGRKEGKVKSKDLSKSPKDLIRSKRLVIAGSTVAGGALGAGLGRLSSSKLTEKINILTKKSNKSPKDLEELKKLKARRLKRIALGTGAGAAVGGAAGYAYNKYN